MADGKKSVILPKNASTELNVVEKPYTHKKSWSKEAEAFASELAQASWHSYKCRPAGAEQGYFLIVHWYPKEKSWVPLYLQRSHRSVNSHLNRIFSGKEMTPISKYLSSFPKNLRKRVYIKWLLESSQEKNCVDFKEVLHSFCAKYFQGDMLPFNEEEMEALPENFTLLVY